MYIFDSLIYKNPKINIATFIVLFLVLTGDPEPNVSL